MLSRVRRTCGFASSICCICGLLTIMLRSMSGLDMSPSIIGLLGGKGVDR